MTPEEIEYMELIIASYKDDNSMLSAWEQGFIKDVAARFEKYGNDTHMSARQWEFIDKAAEKLGVSR